MERTAVPLLPRIRPVRPVAFALLRSLCSRRYTVVTLQSSRCNRRAVALLPDPAAIDCTADSTAALLARPPQATQLPSPTASARLRPGDRSTVSGEQL